MNLNQITLPAFDLPASIAFYQRLGLELIVSAPHYARFKCPVGEATLSLHDVASEAARSAASSAVPAQGAGGAVIYFETAQLDEVVHALRDAGWVFSQAPRDEPWLWREARIPDPAGNMVCLYWAGTNRLHPPWRIRGPEPPPGVNVRSSGPQRQVRFVFRPFSLSDAPAFVQALRESRRTVGRWLSWAVDAYSVEQAESWFELCDRERESELSYEVGIFDADSGDLVGGCGLNRFDTLNACCNLGYWVRESRQRQGAGLAAVSTLAKYGFDRLIMQRLEIVVAAGNLPSQALAEKAGAVREGLARQRLLVHGQGVDAYVFSLVNGA